MDEYKWFKDDFENNMSNTSSDETKYSYQSDDDIRNEGTESFESESFQSEQQSSYSQDNESEAGENHFDADYTPYGSDKFYNTNIKQNKSKKRVPVYAFVAAIVLTAAVSVTGSIYIPKAIDYIKEERLIASVIDEKGDGEKKAGAKVVAKAIADKDGNEALTTPEIVDMVGPAVVGIVSKSTATYGYYGFFGFETPQEQSSSGSGVIISSDGYIVTNNHVIENANEVKVILNTNENYTAKVIGKDSRTDLAVLKIDASELPFAKMGESSQLRVGDTAIAIGNPLGQEFAGTTTQGIISGLNRSVTIDNKQLNLIQTDAAINPGNSGGALVNAYGQLIGINTAKISSSSLEGLGFAIPIDEAKPIIEDLIDNGYVRGRPVIGIGGSAVTERDAEVYENLTVGVYVSSMTPDSPAYLAGIKIGDIITSCDGKKVETVEDINEIKNKKQPGDKMTVTVYRQGKKHNIELVLGEEMPSVQ